MRLRYTSRFRNDLNRAARRGKDLEKLWDVVGHLQSGRALPDRNRAHRLLGRWERHWECHIEPDWLLIWHCSDNELILTRTGTLADLFG